MYQVWAGQEHAGSRGTWSRRGKRIKVWQSREGRRAEHVPLPGASRLEARPAGESAAVGLPAPAGGSAAPPSPGSSTAFHSLVLKLSCWKLPFSTGTRFKDNRAVCFNSSQ